jgi:hypothetical protein
MSKALFVVSIYNYHREVQPVVENFVRQGWQVVAAIGWLGHTADEAASAYASLGCEVMRLPKDMAYPGQEASGKQSGVQDEAGKRAAARPGVLRRIVTCVRLIQRMWQIRGRIAGVVRRIRPDVVLSGPFHSCGTFDNAFVLECRRRRILHCCYPVSSYHGRKSAILARFNNLAMGMLPQVLKVDCDALNGWMSRLFPQWTQTRDGKTIFMWEPMTMLAARLTGLLERDIWQKPSPDFDAVFVFNRFSRGLLESNGFPMDKVVTVGVPLLDAAVARSLDPAARRGMLADIGLREDEPFLLFNVEPAAEHHYCDWDRHWQNFRIMMGIATRQGLPVVLSLHPLCRLEDYLFAETEYGVRIARNWKIHDLYPLCRFVVSFPCSTNLLAETFGKPLAIYDFFGMAQAGSPRAEEFRLPGALVGHAADEIEACVKQAASMESRSAATSERMLPASDAIRQHIEALLMTAPGRRLTTCMN